MWFRFLVGLLFVTLFLGGCSPKNGEAQDKKKEEEQVLIPVEAEQVTRMDVTASYSGTAVLEADRAADVVGRIAEVVRKIHVEEGDRVVKGQVLASLENERLLLEVKKARANLEKIHNELKRMQELYSKQLASTEAYDRLKYEAKSLQASTELAELELSYSEIRAPIDGIITGRMIKEGNQVKPGEVLFNIIDPDSLMALVHVPENDLGLIRRGLEVIMNIDSLAGEAFPGHVSRITPRIDDKTGTFRVTVKMAANDNLLPGMFGRVNIIHDTHLNALVVPAAALLFEDDGESVFKVLEGGAVERMEIETAYRQGRWIEVMKGLEEGDRVVTTGKTTLHQEAKVEVINQEN